jgi:hypothetical protein
VESVTRRASNSCPFQCGHQDVNVPFFSPLGAGPSPLPYTHPTLQTWTQKPRITKPSPQNGANADIVENMTKANLDDEHSEAHDVSSHGMLAILEV